MDESGKPPQVKASGWKILLILAAAFGTFIGGMELFVGPARSCEIPFFSRIALNFAVLSLFFSVIYVGLSFTADHVRRTAEMYPSPDGRSVWHVQWALRWGAVSNIGYFLVMLSLGRMIQYEDGTIWRTFPWLLGSGILIMLSCNLLVWFRHPSFHEYGKKATLLAGAIFSPLFVSLVIYWAYNPFFFEPAAVFVLQSVASATAGIIVSFSDNRRYKRAMAATADRDEAK